MAADEIVPQYGRRAAGFRNQPRAGVELGLSVLRGQLTAEEAARYVLGARGQALTRHQLADAAVRHATARALRESGFAVVHTPGKIKGGPHTSVVWPSADPLTLQQVPWPAETSEKFDSCFNEAGR